MKIMKKVALFQNGFLTLLVGMSLMAASLNAAPVALEKAVANLNIATGHLKEVSKGVKDAKTKTLIKDALKSAAFVTRAGATCSPQMAQKALMKVQKVLAAVAKKQKQLEHKSHFHHKHSSSSFSWSSSSSSSSSESCDVCGEISEIASDVEECCDEIKSEINRIIEILSIDFPCDNTNAINSVPIVIRESGKYCVVRDLVYNGPNTAITVLADNVTINFQNHSLTLTDQSAEGILADGVYEFTLENDIIKGSNVFQTDTSVAIHLKDVQKASLKGLYTKNTTTGIWIEGCEDVTIADCLLEAHESSPIGVAASVSPLSNGAAVWISASNGVKIDSSVFHALESDSTDINRSNSAIVVDDFSENIAVTNSNFSDWLSTFVLRSVDGVIIDNCKAIANSNSPYHLVRLGDCDQDYQANDLIIRNSQFKKASSEVPYFDGFLMLNGSGCLLENVIVDTATFTSEEFPIAAGIHIGEGECGRYSNILARDCIFTGSNAYTVLIHNGSNVVIEDSVIRAIYGVGVSMLNADGCQVKNCDITGDTGVRLETTGKNAIMKNRVHGAGYVGILVQDNSGNHISENTVYGNQSGIIIAAFPETPILTEVRFNTSCNNFNVNCLNVDPWQTPGEDAVAGTNLCCDEGE